MPFGPMELMLILLILVMLFGATKLPAIGAGLGQGIREFKNNLTGSSDDDESKPGKRELKG